MSCCSCREKPTTSEKDGRRSERDRLRERERELEWDAADREAEEKERRRLWELEQERQRLAETEWRESSRKRSRSRSRDRDRGRNRDSGDYDRGGDSRRARVDEGASSRGHSSRADEYTNGGAAAANGGAAAADDKASKEDGGPTFDTELTAEELRMMQAMGIPFTFDTTQGKHVEDESANAGAVKIKSKRSARQFMNRRGGFNRPLPAERTGEKVVRD